MKIITTTNSRLLYNRLFTILSELPDTMLTAITENLDEAHEIINKNEVQVLIAVFHNIENSIFQKIKEIKKNNRNLIIIILTGNLDEPYLKQWKAAGADYIFDYVFHFNKVIDVLTSCIYKDLLDSFKSNKLTQKITIERNEVN